MQQTIHVALRVTVVVLLTAGLAVAQLTSPNSTSVIVYVHDSTITSSADTQYVHAPMEATEYTDGFSRAVQAQMKLRGRVGADAIVTDRAYDSTGRVDRIYKRIPSETNGAYKTGIPAEANQYYSDTGEGADAQGYPYTEPVAWNDPLGRPQTVGYPGAVFSLTGVGGQTHEPRTWYCASVDGEGIDPANFATFQNYTFWYDSQSTCRVTVTRDANGHWAQSAYDAFGRTVMHWEEAWGEHDEGIACAWYRYDKVGNLLDATPPHGTVGSSRYWSNSLGQIIKTYTPDSKNTTYGYDNAGNLVRMVDANMAKRVDTTTSLLEMQACIGYDIFDRPNSVYVRELYPYNVTHLYRKLRVVYDDANDAAPYIAGTHITTQQLSALRNTKGEVAVVISYGEECPYVPDLADEPVCTTKVIDAFSYNEDGLLETKYKSIPGVPLQTFTYDYDFVGKLRSITYHNGTQEIVTTYQYNENGVLAGAKRDGRKLIDYGYTGTLDLLERRYRKGPAGFEETAASTKYTRSVRDWVVNLLTHPFYPETDTIFSQNLSYEQAGQTAGLYDGTITATEIYQPGMPSKQRIDLAYEYDKGNRLIATLSQFQPEYEARFEYDRANRLIKKREPYTGDTAVDWGAYEYESMTSRLKRINNAGARSHAEAYLYDENGNMVLDRSKRMGIVYDYRDMPVLFRFYDTIPAGVAAQEAGNLEETRPSDVTLLSYVRVMYDAGGNRVFKQTHIPGVAD